MSRKRSEFDISARLNNFTYRQNLERLQELALTRFQWNKMPDTVSTWFLEDALVNDGMATYFRDEAMGDLVLKCTISDKMTVYNLPKSWRAYAVNGYNRYLNNKNAVIIWNNYLHTNCWLQLEQYALRLYNLDRIIDINANGQKTPYILQCSEKERLSLLNLYKEVDGNAPVVKASKDLDLNAIKVLNTNAPYIADKIYDLKVKIWNEALTYLGIANMSETKKERMITDEVQRSQGGTIASRYSGLISRQEAADQINKMFGTDISVNFRDFTAQELELPGAAAEDPKEDPEEENENE